MDLDSDLDGLDRDRLVAEVKRLRYREALERELPDAPPADDEYE